MLRRALFVGDPHAVLEELADCQALVDLIVRTCVERDITKLVLLGDQHHTFSTVRVEVTQFYKQVLYTLRAQRRLIDVLMLRGNHDMPHAGGGAGDALLAYDGMPGVMVIRDEICTDRDLPGVAFLGYQASPKGFEQKTLGAPNANTMVCHQTFSGAIFENGFKCPDGVDPNLIPQKIIISGHIHTGQKFGKVWYPGAPRWRILSDANVQRAIWIVTFDETGTMVNHEAIDTGTVCRRLLSFEDTYGKPIDLDELKLDAKDVIRVTVKGPAKFCEERVPRWQALGARPQTVKTDRNRPTGAVKESDGLAMAFDKYVKRFVAPGGTPKGRLEELVKERIHVG